ncbi:hypothetical protein HK102_011927 [Quaeritorhiza haematococci]|nr:hypothetical protein HK102_011927 [Quaeritorhiza haematococci]
MKAGRVSYIILQRPCMHHASEKAQDLYEATTPGIPPHKTIHLPAMPSIKVVVAIAFACVLGLSFPAENAVNAVAIQPPSSQPDLSRCFEAAARCEESSWCVPGAYGHIKCKRCVGMDCWTSLYGSSEGN